MLPAQRLETYKTKMQKENKQAFLACDFGTLTHCAKTKANTTLFPYGKGPKVRPRHTRAVAEANIASNEPLVSEAKPKSGHPAVLSLDTMFKTKMLTGKHPRTWNPKMRPFLYPRRKDDRHVFQAHEVKRHLYRGMKLLKRKTRKGHSVLFVGSHFFFKKWFRRCAKETFSFYIDQKWLGGLFTNRDTLLHSVQTLRRLEQEQYDGTWKKLPKKELSRALKLKRKLQKTLNGVKYMTTWIKVQIPDPRRPWQKITVDKEVIFLPSVAIFFGAKPEKKPLLECQQLGIKTLGFVDSDENPRACRYPLPLNYLSFHALKKAMQVLKYGILTGREQYKQNLEKKKQAQEAYHKRMRNKKSRRKSKPDSNPRVKGARFGV